MLDVILEEVLLGVAGFLPVVGTKDRASLQTVCLTFAVQKVRLALDLVVP